MFYDWNREPLCWSRGTATLVSRLTFCLDKQYAWKHSRGFTLLVRGRSPFWSSTAFTLRFMLSLTYLSATCDWNDGRDTDLGMAAQPKQCHLLSFKTRYSLEPRSRAFELGIWRPSWRYFPTGARSGFTPVHPHSAHWRQLSGFHPHPHTTLALTKRPQCARAWWTHRSVIGQFWLANRLVPNHRTDQTIPRAFSYTASITTPLATDQW